MWNYRPASPFSFTKRDSAISRSDNGGVRQTPTRWFQDKWNNVESSGDLDQSLAIDIETYLPEDPNFKTDIASMSNSLELRAPFQDHKLVELGGSFASNLKFKNGETKYILKKLVEEFLPVELVYRKKMGFGIPRASWMRNELASLVNDVLLGSTAKDRGWFDQNEVRRQVARHRGSFDRDRLLWPLPTIEL